MVSVSIETEMSSSVISPRHIRHVTETPATPATTDEKEEHGEDQIHKHDEKDGHHHGPGGGTADLVCPGSGGEALEAANGSNGNAKHHAFNQAGNDVAEEEGVD